MPLHHTFLSTPIGLMKAAATDAGLCYLQFAEAKYADKLWDKVLGGLETPVLEAENDVLAALRLQLDAYFAERLKQFNLPLGASGTAFQQRVWQSLLQIPYGSTCSYLEQARSLGDTKAIRAVATANGANPIAIVTPCHRVLGSKGELTGYAGGLQRKRFLLELEGFSSSPSLF